MEHKCPHCGRQLPEAAAFCPYCETSLVQKEPAALPKLHSRRALLAIGAALLLAAVIAAGALLLRRGPRVYDPGGAEVNYPTGAGAVHLYLSFGEGVASEREISLAEGTVTLLPSQLAADADDPDAFWAEYVQDASVEAFPRDSGEPLKPTLPHKDPNFPRCVVMSDVECAAECGVNELVWTVNMKNGDAVVLRQEITVSPLQALVFSPEDTPLDTADDLMALLERLENEPSDLPAQVFLPPVIYDKPILMGSRAVDLYGSRDDSNGNVTTFTAGLELSAQQPVAAKLSGLEFHGQGGTGLLTSAGVTVIQCSFTGWDTGLSVTEGGWACLWGCSFRQNGVGLKLNSYTATLTDRGPQKCDFLDNGVGVEALALPINALTLDSSNRFSGNDTDVSNPNRLLINMDSAVIE